MKPFSFLSRPRLLLSAALVVAMLLVAGLAPRAVAQEGEGGEEKKPAAEEKKEEKKGASMADVRDVSNFQVFTHVLYSIRWWAPVLGLCSIAIVTIVVLLALELRMGAAVPPSFVEDFTETVNKRRFKEAYEMAKDDTSFVARVLAAGMARLQYGIEDAREASFSMLESVKAGKEQLIVYLATIGALGPLLGLVGTVWSMIRIFMVMGRSPVALPPAIIAEAISEGLGVTLVGIGLSLPAIFFHALFKNRLVKLTHEAGTVADDLLTQMYYNSKKPATSSSPAVEAEPAPTARVADKEKERTPGIKK
jgi:biopolymer transport protein ExbB